MVEPIKIYVHYNERERFYTVMVIDNDMILYSDAVHPELIDHEISERVEEFSDTDREVKVFK